MEQAAHDVELLFYFRDYFIFKVFRQKRQGLKIACLEAIAFRKGWIDEERMRELAQPMLKNQYGQYLLQVIEEKKRKINSDTLARR